jgi:hypothetical protein
MNNENEEIIYICPHCNDEINRIYYNVSTSESGVAYLTREERNTISSRGTETIQTTQATDFEQNDSGEWNDDPTYECENCGHSLELDEIIIKEKIIKTKPKEIIEPEDAVESKTNIILRYKNIAKPPKNAEDLSNLGICKCEKCYSTFFPYAMEKFRSTHDQIIICPKCNHTMSLNDNMLKTSEEIEQIYV